MSAEKHQCAGRTYPDNYSRGYACSVNAKFYEAEAKFGQEDGEEKWWCHHHAPSKIKEREAKKKAEWDATYGADEARREAGTDRAQKLTELFGVQFGTQWNGYSKQYTGGVTLGAESCDKLIAALEAFVGLVEEQQ